MARICLLFIVLIAPFTVQVQAQISWNKDGNSYTTVENGAIVEVTLPAMTKTTLVSAEQLAPLGMQAHERTAGSRRGGGDLEYAFSGDHSRLLLLAKPVREYHNTYHSAWVFDRKTNALLPVARERILNAKISPDGTKVAYVLNNNIYSVEIGNSVGAPVALTTDGNDKLLNGWFDYAYSEELYCVDGFRWSPDSKSIAYWQNDISHVGTFYMINNTDSIYPKIIAIPFSKVGEPIAQARIGVVSLATRTTKWMNIDGDPSSHYLARMEWTPDGARVITQQLNRAQNNSKLVLSDPASGESKVIYNESDDAWIDLKAFWSHAGGNDWDWIEGGKAFLWVSEKDGWRHIYRVGLDGQETLLTKGNFDVTSVSGCDEVKGYLYFGASPENATQRYLYRASLSKTAAPVRVTPDLAGTHGYILSPNGRWAQHSFSSHLYMPATEWVSLPDHKALNAAESIASHLTPTPQGRQTKFFTITTADGVTMDAWMIKPLNFDSTKKYPVIFYTYSEPVGATVSDVATPGRAGFFNVDDGYIFMSVEGRGAQTPKGRAWRKSIYKNVGWINVNDQAAACREVLKWPFIDASRVAVFGSSGGGSTTQNLLFRYPELYKVGLASAGVPNQLIYNTIYEERFMGVLPENRDAYIKCNPLTYAKNLQGHLLIMHGTGDHNVNYQGEEMLLNELIKYNRQFQFMPYPNRTHGITEGEGTILHKTTLMANFLKQWCPAGGR